MTTDDSFSFFDETFAASLVGKYVLVGLTIQSHDGRTIERRQVHGIVVSADRRTGVTIDLHGSRKGEKYVLPPDTRDFRPGKLGMYRPRDSDDIVWNPDFTCSWTITRPPPEGRPAD